MQPALQTLQERTVESLSPLQFPFIKGKKITTCCFICIYAHGRVCCAVFYKKTPQIWETSSLRGDSSLDKLGEMRLISKADKKHILINDPFCLFISFFILSGFVCILFRGFVCVGAVAESIMQFVPLFSPCLTAELFLWQKRPIIFVSFLFCFCFLLSTYIVYL